jgi:hypothetical protein
MGAEEAGGDDLGVVEDEEVGGVEEAGEVGDVVVGEGLGFAAKEEKAGRVARVGGLGGDGGGGELVGEKGSEGVGGGWGLTGGLAWARFHVCKTFFAGYGNSRQTHLLWLSCWW